MKYRNTKTGATINSPFNINGGDWVEYTGKENKAESKEEYVEEEIDLEAMTNKELEEFAKEHDVNLTTDDKRNKETRISAIAKAFE